MKYYGNGENKKYKVIGTVDWIDAMDKGTPVGYLKDKGMLIDYLLNVKTYCESNKTRKKLIENDYIVLGTDGIAELEEVDYNGEQYFFGMHEGDMFKDELWVLKEAPAIANNKYFKWKINKKHGSLECKIIDGNFEFRCIVKQDGDAIIDVCYCKCENKHRNRVTIEQIEISNATNEDIVDAIKLWKKEFRKELAA